MSALAQKRYVGMEVAAMTLVCGLMEFVVIVGIADWYTGNSVITGFQVSIVCFVAAAISLLVLPYGLFTTHSLPNRLLAVSGGLFLMLALIRLMTGAALI